MTDSDHQQPTHHDPDYAHGRPNNAGAAAAMLAGAPSLPVHSEMSLAVATGQAYAVLDVAEAIRELAAAVRANGASR